MGLIKRHFICKAPESGPSRGRAETEMEADSRAACCSGKNAGLWVSAAPPAPTAALTGYFHSPMAFPLWEETVPSSASILSDLVNFITAEVCSRLRCVHMLKGKTKTKMGMPPEHVLLCICPESPDSELPSLVPVFYWSSPTLRVRGSFVATDS